MSKAADRYKKAHWGINPKWTKRIHHPMLGAETPVVQMGWLCGLTYEDEHGAMKKVPLADEQGHVAFSDDAKERLYLFVSERTRQKLKKFDGQLFPCDEVAKAAGGRQAKFPVPKKRVFVLGLVKEIMYFTEKKDDGSSYYQHHFGEESGVYPYVAVDAEGYLYLLGGNYTVPDAGITD